MPDDIEIEEESNGHGEDEDYAALVKELDEKGILADGEKIIQEGGIHPFAIDTRQRASNASLLASVPNVERYYGKDEDERIKRQRGLLLDVINRTNFRSDKEFKYFLDWVEWCEEFGVGLEGPIRYCVAVNSINGLSREQYRDAITTWRLRQYGSSYNRDKDKPKSTQGKLS